MESITLPVKQQKIVGVNNKAAWTLYSVVIWLFATLILFFVYLGTDNIVLLPVFFVSFLCIIPIFIVGNHIMKKYRGENAFFVEEVCFCAKNGELFAGEILITNIWLERKSKCICINDTKKVKTNVDGIPVSSDSSNFIGWIEEPYVEDFSLFLQRNGIRMERKTSNGSRKEK